LGASRLDHLVVIAYVLVDQYDRNILSLPGELVESFLDSGLLGFGIDDEVVFLRVRGLGDMLCTRSVSSETFIAQPWVATYSDASQQNAGHRILYRVSWESCFSELEAKSNLISDHRQELPIFVCGLR
jgi:hypothetical protein